MVDELVNIRDAKARWSQLVARAERGARITIARAGRPVARLVPVPVSVPVPSGKRRQLPAGDPLLNLEGFAVEGPGGALSNEDIDRALFGRS